MPDQQDPILVALTEIRMELAAIREHLQQPKPTTDPVERIATVLGTAASLATLARSGGVVHHTLADAARQAIEARRRDLLGAVALVHGPPSPEPAPEPAPQEGA